MFLELQSGYEKLNTRVREYTVAISNWFQSFEYPVKLGMFYMRHWML